MLVFTMSYTSGCWFTLLTSSKPEGKTTQGGWYLSLLCLSKTSLTRWKTAVSWCECRQPHPGIGHVRRWTWYKDGCNRCNHPKGYIKTTNLVNCWGGRWAKPFDGEPQAFWKNLTGLFRQSVKPWTALVSVRNKAFFFVSIRLLLIAIAWSTIKGTFGLLWWSVAQSWCHLHPEQGWAAHLQTSLADEFRWLNGKFTELALDFVAYKL